MPRPVASRLTLTVVAACATVAAAALLWPDAAAGCSVVLGPHPWRSPQVTAMVLHGTRDTVTAGRAWSYADWRNATLERGRDLPATYLWEHVVDVWSQHPWRQRFGQVAALDQVGGAGRDDLQALLSRGQRRAVIVNWGYGSPCGGKIYVPPDGALILPDDSAIFLTARLRPRAQWAGDLPTFDVIDGGAPYPYWQRALGRLAYDGEDSDAAGGRLPWLTPDQYFTLYTTLPSTRDRPPDASDYAPLYAWAHTHPDLARRFPAFRLLARAHDLDRSLHRDR